jgi:hypothetical protein
MGRTIQFLCTKQCAGNSGLEGVEERAMAFFRAAFAQIPNLPASWSSHFRPLRQCGRSSNSTSRLALEAISSATRSPLRVCRVWPTPNNHVTCRAIYGFATSAPPRKLGTDSKLTTTLFDHIIDPRSNEYIRSAIIQLNTPFEQREPPTLQTLRISRSFRPPSRIEAHVSADICITPSQPQTLPEQPTRILVWQQLH